MAGRSAPRTHGVLDALCSRDRTQCELKVTIVCAHPDDETLGAAGRLPHLRHVEIVHVTDGAPRDMVDAIANGFTSREAYARARAAERDQALAVAAVSPSRIHDLGRIDQDASFGLVALTQDLVTLFELGHPDIVLTHAYEGGHPGHDAVAFAVHGATELVGARTNAAPLIAELTGYH